MHDEHPLCSSPSSLTPHSAKLRASTLLPLSPLLRLPSSLTPALQRKKQVDLGKATAGYQRYIAAVPVETRQAGNPLHPAVR